MRFYNVLEKVEREKFLQQIEGAVKDNDHTCKKVVSMAAGDGSLSRTILFMKTSKVMSQALLQGKV